LDRVGGAQCTPNCSNSEIEITQTLHGERQNLTENLQPAVFVPESLTGIALRETSKNGAYPAFIIDEYGEIQGIVTVQDVMEAVTAEFKPARPEDASAVRCEDGAWLPDGFIRIPELKDRPF
jgi:putative hemolysin